MITKAVSKVQSNLQFQSHKLKLMIRLNFITFQMTQRKPVFPVPAGPAGAPPIDIARAWARVM